MQKSQYAGLVSSGILHNTWILHFLCTIPELFSWYFKFSSQESQNICIICFVAFFIWFIGIGVQVFLFCFADARSYDETITLNRFPEINSSFINRQLLWWFNPIAIIGAKRALDLNDLYDLNYGSSSAYLVPLWKRYWEPTIKSIFS